MSILHEGVLKFESGILQKEGIYFHTACTFAKRHLYYALWGADYLCASPYCVNREHFNAFLLFFIKSGEMHFIYRGHGFVARANDVVLIDCNHLHTYYAESNVRFFWFHFHGCSSQAYCGFLWEQYGAHFPNMPGLERDFLSMLQMLPMGAEADDRISFTIHHLLALLNTQGHRTQFLSPPIAQAKAFIEQHFQEDLSNDTIADFVSLSKFYFARRFREELGTSPHTYLLEVRLTYAKTRLSESDDSIEQIAFDCAFSSASNFIRTFKKSTGMTPHKFRMLFDSSLGRPAHFAPDGHPGPQ